MIDYHDKIDCALFHLNNEIISIAIIINILECEIQKHTGTSEYDSYNKSFLSGQIHAYKDIFIKLERIYNKYQQYMYVTEETKEAE